MKVSVFNQQNDLSIAPKSVKPVIKEVLSLENRKTDEISVYFVTSEEISLIHGEFFHDHSPTDCITFPLDQNENVGYHILGEIYVCPKTAIDYVLKTKKKDFYSETTLYLVHGVLHLLGFRDDDEKERKKMKRSEKKIMEHLIYSEILLFGI